MKLSRRLLVGVVAALTITACVSTVEAQRDRPARGGRQFGGFGGGAPGGMGPGMGAAGIETMLLRREDVRKELELLDEQVEKLQGLRDEIDMRSMFQDLRDVPQEERREKMQQALEQARNKMQARMNEILLPHQVARLDELAVQFSMRGAGGLLGGQVAEKLGVSEEQGEQLREKSREMRREMERKLQEQLIKELKPEQQEKLKKLMGKPFTFEETERQFRPGGDAGGRRPQPGNRGGGGRTGTRRGARGQN